jgi:hypothetical protein
MKGKRRLKIEGLHKILGMKWGSEDQWSVVSAHHFVEVGYSFTIKESIDNIGNGPEMSILLSELGKYSVRRGEWVWEIKPLNSTKEGRELDRWEIFHQKELLRNLCYEVQVSRVRIL